MSNIRQGLKDRASNIIEIQRIEIARYSNKAYFPGEFFFHIFEKSSNRCKYIIFTKSFYLILLALLENFFYIYTILLVKI